MIDSFSVADLCMFPTKRRNINLAQASIYDCRLRTLLQYIRTRAVSI